MSFPSGFQQFNTGIPNMRGFQVSTLDPYQQNLYQNLMQGISANPAQILSRQALGDPSYYEPQEQQALRQFREEVMPSIGSRFVGRLGGSAAQGAFAKAGSDLSQNLYADRQRIKQQALQDLIGLENSLLNRNTFENVLTPKRPSMWQQIFSGLGGVVGSGVQTGGQLALLKKFGVI